MHRPLRPLTIHLPLLGLLATSAAGQSLVSEAEVIAYSLGQVAPGLAPFEIGGGGAVENPIVSEGDLLAFRIRLVDPSITSVSSTSHIASLWAGMGQIIRVQCQTSSGTKKTMIAKQIRCKNPRSFGDKRKAASYHVEAAFYSKYSQ